MYFHIYFNQSVHCRQKHAFKSSFAIRLRRWREALLGRQELSLFTVPTILFRKGERKGEKAEQAEEDKEESIFTTLNAGEIYHMSCIRDTMHCNGFNNSLSKIAF